MRRCKRYSIKLTVPAGLSRSSPTGGVGVSTHGAMVRQLMKHALPPGSPPARTRNTVLYILQYQAVADRLAILTEEQIS